MHAIGPLTVIPYVDMFDFLDEILADDIPVVPMPGTSKVSTSVPNLDSSKVLNWSDSLSNRLYHINDQIPLCIV